MGIEQYVHNPVVVVYAEHRGVLSLLGGDNILCVDSSNVRTVFDVVVNHL